MPGRNSLIEVEQAITQLVALHTSLKNLSNDSVMQQSYEALVVCQAAAVAAEAAVWIICTAKRSR